MNRFKSAAALICLFAVFAGSLPAQLADRSGEYNESPSQIRGMIERYSADFGSLDRFYSAPGSKNRAKRFREFYSEWLARLEKQDFAKLNDDEQIDHLLFKNYLNHQLAELERAQAQIAEMSTLVPYADVINDLEDARRRLETTDAAKSAAILDDLDKKIAETRKKIDSGAVEKPKKTVANRAARYVDSLRRVLRNWFNFHKGYDPSFSWWNDAPYKSVDKNLENYQKFLLDKLVGIAPDDKTTIIGDPIGRDALIRELEYEMIPYSPDELVEIANKEFAWCEAEMKKASRDMGFGDDWKAALEAVKNKYVEPGKQPELIRDQALKAIEFLEKNDLISIPQLAKETWRMEMMSPERQLIAPFFLGGETILVSYPTDTMTHEQKMMSMRGNNPHFTNAVVHHELIPGHHMQRFMNNRYRPYRQMFYTPFWMEGWALYWEFLLWDKNFNTTPEDKVGALFWRMHRAARIIFSLNFHLEKMTPAEAVDFLVDRVGHERENALGEVRRSFSGDYGPLYQIAYMMGGLQFKELHRELVGSKKMTDGQFHDAVLREGPVPVEMVRAILLKQRLSAEFQTNWRFYPGLK